MLSSCCHLFCRYSEESATDAMASPKADVEVKKGIEELVEQWDAVLQHVTPRDAESEDDAESTKTQPWRPRSRQRLHDEFEQGNIARTAQPGSPRPSKQPTPARAGSLTPYNRKFKPSVDMPNFQPEWQEVDDLVKSMRTILRNSYYKDDDRLNPEDETKVRRVLEYHPRAHERTGPEVDHIQVRRVRPHTRGFWVVRTDGTADDFSFHKCIKAKVAAEFPDLLEHYASLYEPWTVFATNRAR